MQFYWHLHHKILLEPCYDYEGRMVYVDKYKPAEEQELRLRLLKPVEGELPAELIEAGQKYAEAWQKCDEAGQKREEAWQKYAEAWQKRDEAWQKYDEVLEKYAIEINALHEKECPDCPWDGKTIFPKSRKK